MAVDEERLEAAARNSTGKKGEQRTSETPQGTWLGGAQKRSLWLCYAGPLAEKQKRGISGKRHSRFHGKKQLEKLGEEEHEEEEPAKERRREYTDLG